MIVFHRVLIATAILFCALFSVWSFVAFRTNGNVMTLLMAGSFAVATGGLTYYLAHLRRFLGR